MLDTTIRLTKRDSERLARLATYGETKGAVVAKLLDRYETSANA